MRFLIAVSVVAVLGGLTFVYVKPVAHPITGEAIPLERLVQHYKGGGR
jgi:hypothetical protein